MKKNIIAILSLVAIVSVSATSAHAGWSFGPEVSAFKESPTKGRSQAGLGFTILRGGESAKKATTSANTVYKSAVSSSATSAASTVPAQATVTPGANGGAWVIQQKPSGPTHTMVAVPNDQLDKVPSGSVVSSETAEIKKP